MRSHGHMDQVLAGRGPLTAARVVAVACHEAPVALSAEAEQEIARSRKVIESLAGDVRPHYGISTGFGALANRHIPDSARARLQRSLVRSHASGTGAEVEREVVRALMLLRLSTMATGRTGVRLETAAAYAALLNAGITPVVYEYGSLGCSGDLAPLAHCALAVMGEGEVRAAQNTLMPAARTLQAAGITPVALGEKEGLALINGTDGMLGMLPGGTRVRTPEPPRSPPDVALAACSGPRTERAAGHLAARAAQAGTCSAGRT